MSAVLSELGFQHVFEPATQTGAPTLLLLHGTGGDQHDLLPLGRTIAPGAALLSPLGKISENGAPRFFRRLAEGVFDEKDLAFRTEELAHFVSAAAGHYGVNSARVFAVGFSNGANIAASLLLRRPEQLAGACLLRAMVPFVPESLPPLTDKPVLLLEGIADSIVPRENASRLAALFEESGARVQLHWTPAGHGMTAEDVSTAKAWFKQFYAS
jgi:phospholipase/carboxylesterase